MKNIFKRALALTMIAALFAVSAFAAPAISGVSYNSTTGKLSATVSGYEAGKDATILILKKGATLATAGNDDIVYIDQLAADAEGKVTYEVPIKDRATALSATSVNLYVGGENVATAVEYKNTEGTLADINISGDPAPVATYTATVPVGTYNTIEAAVAALVVKKTVGGAETILAASEYTVEKEETTTNNWTIKVKVEGVEVASTTVTITPVAPGEKGGIKGTVKYALASGDKVAPYALVLVTAQGDKDVVATAVTDVDGNFEITGLDAGSYRVIVRWASILKSSVTSYINTTVENVEVTAGNATVAKTTGNEYIRVKKLLKGDTNEDGKVDLADYTNLSGNFGKTND